MNPENINIKKRKIPAWIKGAILGVLIWLYDYDFFINAGGPETPISDFIKNKFGVENSNALFSLLVLLIAGALVGVTIYWLVGNIKDRVLKNERGH